MKCIWATQNARICFSEVPTPKGAASFFCDKSGPTTLHCNTLSIKEKRRNFQHQHNNMGDITPEAKAIQEAFIAEYMENANFNKYITAVGISNVEVGFPDAKLEPSESSSDLVLGVHLVKQLPSTLVLPDRYRGMRVFYRVTGQIGLL